MAQGDKKKDQKPSDDLGSLMAGLGFTPADMAALQSQVQSQATDDPPIYWGTANSRGRQTRNSPIIHKSEALVAPARWKAEDLSSFQRRMFDAGLFGNMTETDIPFGTFDVYTQQAWKQLVDSAEAYTAVGQKIRPQDILDRMPAVGGGPKARERDPFSAQVANPADIRRGLKAAAREVLGNGDLPDDQLGRMVVAFQAQQVQAQKAAYTANETGGTTVAADFETFAATQVRKLDPVKADSRGAVKVASVIGRMLGGTMPSEGAL